MQDFRDFEDNSADKNLDYPGRKEYDSGMLVQHFLKFCVEEGREGDHGTVVDGKKKEVVVGILMEGVTSMTRIRLHYDAGGPLLTGPSGAGGPIFGKFSTKCCSFSAVSVPIFASKYAVLQHFSKSTRLSS